MRLTRAVLSAASCAMWLNTPSCNSPPAKASSQTDPLARKPSVQRPGKLARQDSSRRASPPACPPDMLHSNDYCIDRYEAVLVEKATDGRELPHPAHKVPANGVRYEARSRAGVLPQAYISRVQAEAACENAGKRLCTVAEWYSACRGSEQRSYPYGNEYKRGACNSGKPHLLSRLFGRDPQRWSYREHFNNPRLAQEPGFLARTGEYGECTSELGVSDMVGNLHEWVQDPVDASLERKVRLVGGVRAAVRRNLGHGVFMGGFFSTTDQQGAGCHFVTIGHEPRYHDYSTGFRCCKDAEAR